MVVCDVSARLSALAHGGPRQVRASDPAALRRIGHRALMGGIAGWILR